MIPLTTEEQKQFSPEDQALAEELLHLAQKTHPSPQFRQVLAAQLQADIPRKPIVMRPRWATAAAAVMLVCFVIALLISPIPSLAQALIGDLFNRVSDSQTFDEPKTFSLQPTAVSAGPSTNNPNLNSAAQQAPFTISVPSYIPDGYELVDADYDALARHFYQLYTTNGQAPYDSFSITQMPVEDAIALDIGASAEVIEVNINDYTGEVVQGSWRAITRSDDESVTVQGREWDHDFPYTQMLWSDGTFVYWMQSPIGQLRLLTLTDWVTIAESLTTAP